MCKFHNHYSLNIDARRQFLSASKVLKSWPHRSMAKLAAESQPRPQQWVSVSECLHISILDFPTVIIQTHALMSNLTWLQNKLGRQLIGKHSGPMQRHSCARITGSGEASTAHERYNYSRAEVCLPSLIVIERDVLVSAVKLCFQLCLRMLLFASRAMIFFPPSPCNKWEKWLKMKASESTGCSCSAHQIHFGKSRWSQWSVRGGKATRVQTDPTENPPTALQPVLHSGSYVGSWFIQTELFLKYLPAVLRKPLVGEQSGLHLLSNHLL